MQLPTPIDIRQHLTRWLGAAVASVDPYHATLRALGRSPAPISSPVIIALGKAAEGMARAAVDWLADHGLVPAGGLVVTDRFTGSLHPALRGIEGDHPEPGPASGRAAAALAELSSSLASGTHVHVFISGGTSSLIAAPVDGIAPEDLQHAFRILHHLGLDIATMNALRGQLTRWSNGRLAIALGDRPVQAWVISDVMQNDLSVVGSGPLLPHSVALDNVLALLAQPEALTTLAPTVRAALTQPSPSVRRIIPHHMVADAQTAAMAVREAAQRDGVAVRVHREPIIGEAAAAGRELADWIRSEVNRRRLPDHRSGILVEPVPRRGEVHVWRSETTVSLPPSAGEGGRAQHMALAVARALKGLGTAEMAVVMVAATDGRDGPTDAAGAIVDAGTLEQMVQAGVDVEAAVQHCDAYPALDRVGALLRTGRTGTNVADLVLVWLWNWY
jgi:hydroxypyruvate reductase